jgi:hypothetical protein
MVFRKVSIERSPSMDEVLMISKNGFRFSSKFILNNKLENKKSMSFYLDDEDPYKLGFEFYDDTGRPDSMVLLLTGVNVKGRNVKGFGLINKSKVLQSIQKDPLKLNRVFNIQRDEESGLFYVLLRPSFEHKIPFDKRNTLPDDLTGIYRYRDKTGSVLYIGKGNVKSRSNSPERREWGIHEIEYSSVPTDEDSLKWESYYIQTYLNEYGLRPPFNRILGHGQSE